MNIATHRNRTSRTFLALGHVAVLLPLMVLAPNTAAANTITDTVIFTEWNFTPVGAPTDPLNGSITFTLDPSVAITNQAIDAVSMTIDGVAFAPSSLLFTVSPTDCAPIQCAPGGDHIWISGTQSQIAFDYSFVTNPAQQIETFFNLSYDVQSAAGTTTYKGLEGESLVLVDGVSPGPPTGVPEPSTPALFCLALIGLGLTRKWGLNRCSVWAARMKPPAKVIYRAPSSSLNSLLDAQRTP